MSCVHSEAEAAWEQRYKDDPESAEAGLVLAAKVLDLAESLFTHSSGTVELENIKAWWNTIPSGTGLNIECEYTIGDIVAVYVERKGWDVGEDVCFGDSRMFSIWIERQ